MFIVVSVDATLGDVVAAQPGAAAVFDRLGLFPAIRRLADDATWAST